MEEVEVCLHSRGVADEHVGTRPLAVRRCIPLRWRLPQPAVGRSGRDRAGQARYPAVSRRSSIQARLDDDATAVLDLRVQAVAVEQRHAHERPDIPEGIGINMSRLPVPKHGERIEVKNDLTAVGQGRISSGLDRLIPTRRPAPATLSESRCSRVDHGFDLRSCPVGPWRVRRTTASRAAFTVPSITGVFLRVPLQGGTAANAHHRPVTDTLEPDAGVRVLGEETLRRG